MSNRHPDHLDINARAAEAAQRRAREANAEKRKRRIERAGYRAGYKALSRRHQLVGRWWTR